MVQKPELIKSGKLETSFSQKSLRVCSTSTSGIRMIGRDLIDVVLLRLFSICNNFVNLFPSDVNCCSRPIVRYIHQLELNVVYSQSGVSEKLLNSKSEIKSAL